VAREIRVLAVPGPSFPVAALVISGLPADSFVYLHRLPQEAEARRALLHAVSDQRRTLVVLDALDSLPELYQAFGDRELAVVASFEKGAQVAWRGTLSLAIEEFADRVIGCPCALVVGGAPEAARWDEEKVRQQIQALQDQGYGAKAISQQLAAESGWPRRQVYQLALSVRKDPPDSTKTITR
jgi:16S rRNA (cytidine1402-2'-O)-methyltransferase